MEKTSGRKFDLRKFMNLVRLQDLPKLLIGLVLGLSLVQTIASLVVPWFTKNLVDMMTLQNLNHTVVILLVAAFIVQGVSGAFSTYYLSYLGESVVANLRKHIWSHTLRLPIPYFDQNRSGETISRINNDTNVIKDLITTHLVTMFTGLISLVGALCILLYLDWSMTLVMLTAVPLIMLIMRPIGRKMHQISKRLQGKMAELTSLLTQVVSEIRLVKSYVAEPVEQKNGEKQINQLFQFGLKEARLVSILQPLMSFVMMFMLVVIIGYGGYRVATGSLTAGELVAFILYLFQIITPLSMMTRFYTSLQKSMGATERLQEILDQKRESSVDVSILANPQLPIQIKDLSFAYPNNETILHQLNLTVQPGKVTAIVGPSGSGKTTLFSLLERFYQPTKGEIRLGDTPISEFSLRDWRSQISYVSQESPLLAGTIRDNICYAMERKVSDEELLQAAKQAYADEFIQMLPQAFDTEVGERGIKLSGGQRQRIAIARAILHDPKILMLDEATSSLDSTSEKVVQDALQNLMQGRTTLVIAHRLSTVIDADQIVVLEKGHITGIGTHDALLKTNTLYQQLVKQQFKQEITS